MDGSRCVVSPARITTPGAIADDKSRPDTAIAQFFVTQRRIPPGQKFPITPLSPREVQRHLHRYATEARMGLPLTPHKLRHIFATALVATGVDIRVVQEALGHAHQSTTEIYTHVRIDTQRQAADHLSYLPHDHDNTENFSSNNDNDFTS